MTGPTQGDKLGPWGRALRPAQWTKNALVASAPVASGRLFEWDILWRTAAAFIVFCGAASATYLFNDAADIDSDRQHPVKKRRPIAAGEISATSAKRVGFVLVALALVGAALLGRRFAVIVALYLATTWAYSHGLKRVVVLDMVLVAAGFAWRAIGGGFATHVPLSWWFVSVVSSGALLLVAGKRLGEFHADHGSVSTRSVLAKYNIVLLDGIALVASVATIAGYVFWAFSQAERPDRQGWLIWLTLIPFILAVARYGQLATRGETEEPDRLVFKDRVLVAFGVAWLVLYLIAISA